MKATLLAATLILSASTALAADVVYEAPAAPVVEAPVYFSWTGGYLGVQGGGSWGNLTDRYDGVEDDYDVNGGLLGVFAGFQRQLDNNIVLGFEGDFDYNWNDEKGSTDILDYKLGTDWAASARLRAGYAIDRTLVYVTGGWATTRGYLEVEEPGFAFNAKETFNGWTIGAGVDHAFTDNVFGRLEYRYNDYGSKNYDFGKIDLDQHTVKVGLGVKF